MKRSWTYHMGMICPKCYHSEVVHFAVDITYPRNQRSTPRLDLETVEHNCPECEPSSDTVMFHCSPKLLKPLVRFNRMGYLTSASGSGWIEDRPGRSSPTRVAIHGPHLDFVDCYGQAQDIGIVEILANELVSSDKYHYRIMLLGRRNYNDLDRSYEFTISTYIPDLADDRAQATDKLKEYRRLFLEFLDELLARLEEYKNGKSD